MRNSWKSFLIALRRSGRDKRARRLILTVAAVVLYAVGTVALYVWLFQQAWSDMGATGILFYGVVFGSGLAGWAIIRRMNRRAGQQLNRSITGQPGRAPASQETQVTPSIAAYLSHRARIVASLLCRAVSEFQIEKQDAGVNVMRARGFLNEYLRGLGLWEEMEPEETNLSSCAGGAWNLDQRIRAIEWAEQLRVLRWVLGVDAEPAPLAHLPLVSARLGADLIQKTVRLSRKIVVEPWQIRAERDTARAYVARIISEMSVRNLFPSDASSEGWEHQMHEKFRGPSKDFLAGDVTVGELPDTKLKHFLLSAQARMTYVDYVLTLLDRSEPIAYSSWLEGRVAGNVKTNT